MGTLEDILGTIGDIGKVAGSASTTIKSIEDLTGSGKSITINPSITIGSNSQGTGSGSSTSSWKMFGFSPLELAGIAAAGGLLVYGAGKVLSGNGHKRVKR